MRWSPLIQLNLHTSLEDIVQTMEQYKRTVQAEEDIQQ